MKNRIFIVLGLIALCVIFFCRCTKEHYLQNEVTWKKVYTKWGASSSKVRLQMQRYTLLNSTASVLCYKGKNDIKAISYKFVEDSLCAVVVIADAERIGVDEVRSSFASYESLGEYESYELFVDTGQNTLFTITLCNSDENKYLSIGYAAIQ